MDSINTKPLFESQQRFINFALSHTSGYRIFNTSDPGTGKTRASLEAWHQSPNRKRLLVVAPLSILRPAWGQDIETYFPGVGFRIAHGSSEERLAAFTSCADVVLINHDGVKWIQAAVNDKKLDLKDFSHLIIDEFTAFKHRETQRGHSALHLSSRIENMILLGGTPNSNEVTDIWFPAYLLDRGMRLGDSFFRFRMQVANSKQVGPKPNMVKWVERVGAREWIADKLRDITFRVTLEECLDMPEHIVNTMYIDMPMPVMKHYQAMEKFSITEFDGYMVDAVHAGARAKKLLQILSGAVYRPDGEIQKVFNDRYELVLDLVEQREHCVVAFNWKHERDGLLAEAKRRGLRYGVIDGDTPPDMRNTITTQFQAGELDVIFAHPQSAAHGFTWTRGTTTIWCSPTYNAEHYQQFNRRIYRAGQTQRTETIRIAARDTCEEAVYNTLDGKMTSMQDLLALMCDMTRLREAG